MSDEDEEVYRKCCGDLVTFATGLVGPADAADVVAVFVRDARLRQIHLATNRVTTLSGSMRMTAAACTFDDCLPDAAVYETEAQWSDHEAVNFAAAKP